LAPAVGRVLSAGSAYRSVFAVIGPEGGLTDEEEQLFIEEGFVAVSLGPSVLRIETACVALACHVQAHLASLCENASDSSEL